MGLRLISALATLALGVTACGAGPPIADPGDVSPTTPPPTMGSPPSTAVPDLVVSGDLEVIVPPGPDGQLPPDLMVGCRTGPVFPFGALHTITPLADGDPGGVTEAIEPFLENEEGQHWPQEGWLILHRSESEILLVNATEDTGTAFMTVTETESGWRWSGAQSGGPCPLDYTVPAGLNTVEWRLDPSAPELQPDSAEIPVLLTEMECVSGQEIGDRLVGPQIVMTEAKIYIAFAAQPPPGDAFDCQGNPEISYTVELPQPRANRQLVEGLATGLDLADFLP